MQEFVYVSAVKGHLVTRFPSLRQPVAQYIGATRRGKDITWNEDQVVAIPVQEWRKYRREYRRAVADGGLKERTKADFERYQAKRAAKDAEDAKARQDAIQKAKKDEAARKRGDAPEPEQQAAAPAVTPETTGADAPAKKRPGKAPQGDK